ncbi:protein NRT1/ PTR FAMILY 5.10-like [Tripterygium wilfordii]|uniref:protein NRT1/ PTR FAMILY 5.10-like n=1 Tax=Tripterygium wilfordii TaxID=458696 RepID=UPI0018F80E40|nr:protein NRT1/ PTR FAMILY 5.10-like [Tripterygium wilfordii]
MDRVAAANDEEILELEIKAGMDRGTANEEEILELEHDSSVDYKGGGQAVKYSTGGWISALFIIAVELAERFAYYGVSSNLITYLTGSLGESTATAAAGVNLWSGIASLLPLLGGLVADSFLGPYRTIVTATIVYLLGLGMLTLLAVLTSHDCPKNGAKKSCSPPQIHIGLFYFALYIVAIGQGGHKPCVQAFGADQFDGKDPEESKAKSSFFNWWYFSSSVGVIVTLLVLVYIQDNLSWALGFGIPCIAMVAALVIFLLGTKTYRFSAKTKTKHPFVRIGRVFVAAIKNWKITPLAIEFQEEGSGSSPSHISKQFKFLHKALFKPAGVMEDGKGCSITEVEEAKAILRLVPIWVSCLGYGIVFAQSSTFFTKQGVTMDRRLTSSVDIPPATLQIFIATSIALLIPVYDRVFVAIARSVTKKPSGITMLQRIGIGMVLSAMAMVIAALIETKRLNTAQEHGLVNVPKATVPMKIWWLVPQYILFGAADVFTIVGLQEFFYDQVPAELRSMGISFYFSIFGTGSLLSSLLVSVINKASKDSWFDSNLNQAHLDRFYWLLAGLSGAGFGLFLCFAKSYIYKR